MTPGVISFLFSGVSGIEWEATDATAGTAPYTYQWQRNENGGAFSNLSGKTSLSLTDETATTPDVLYGYRLVYTDADTTTVTSNEETAELYEGGDFGTSQYYVSG